MHSPLIDILHSRLDAPVQRLFTLIYAYTNGTGRCDIPEEDVLDMLDISSGTLRRYRAQLASAGYATSRLRGGILTAYLIDRAPDARSEAASAQPVRAFDADDEADADADRAADDTIAQPVRGLMPPPASQNSEKRAQAARSAVKSAHSVRGGGVGGEVGGLTDFFQRSIITNPPPPAPPVCAADWDPRAHKPGSPVSQIQRLPGPAEAARTQRLLLDLGVSAEKAGGLAAACGFWRVFSHAIAWRADGTRGVGALIYRLENKWLPPEIPDAMLRPSNELYLVHVLDGHRERHYIPPGYEDLIEH